MAAPGGPPLGGSRAFFRAPGGDRRDPRPPACVSRFGADHGRRAAPEATHPLTERLWAGALRLDALSAAAGTARARAAFEWRAPITPRGAATIGGIFARTEWANGGPGGLDVRKTGLYGNALAALFNGFPPLPLAKLDLAQNPIGGASADAIAAFLSGRFVGALDLRDTRLAPAALGRLFGRLGKLTPNNVPRVVRFSVPPSVDRAVPCDAVFRALALFVECDAPLEEIEASGFVHPQDLGFWLDRLKETGVSKRSGFCARLTFFWTSIRATRASAGAIR